MLEVTKAEKNIKKIIIIGPAHPLRGGIANFNEALCRAIQKEGVECKIFSFSLQYPKFLFPGKTQFDTSAKSSDINIETCINSINPFNWFAVANKIKNEKPDVVVIRYWLPFMAPCLGTIARLLKKKTRIIAITDNVIPHEKRLGDNMLTNYFVNSCHSFVAMSKSVLDDLSKFTSNKSKVFLPHPIYDIFGNKISKTEARKNIQLNESEKLILFFGFIRKYKGLDLLLEAMGDKRIKELRVKLIVAGEFYEDKKFYDDIIAKHQLQNSVIVKDTYIASEEVKNYFCAADMVVQPYRNATQSGVTQIAYHFERPMLVTNVGGLSEIIPNNKVGFVVQPNATSIADALVEFYSKNLEQQFAQNAAEEKKRFSWKSFVDGVLSLAQ